MVHFITSIVMIKFVGRFSYIQLKIQISDQSTHQNEAICPAINNRHQDKKHSRRLEYKLTLSLAAAKLCDEIHR